MPSYRCILFLLLSSPIVSAENWPQFRGPGGSGVSETATPPTKWSETDNIAWIATIPGRAWSSPIVWGSTLFVTSAVSVDGAFKEPSTGIYGNDYAAELAERGLSDEEVMERIITRDIELASETEAIRYMLLPSMPKAAKSCGSEKRIAASRSAADIARTPTRQRHRQQMANASTPISGTLASTAIR